MGRNPFGRQKGAPDYCLWKKYFYIDTAEHLDPEKLKQALAIADKAIREAEKRKRN